MSAKPTGVCPLCTGTKRVPVPEPSQRYKEMIAGYDKATDTFPCTNCGGQYMFMEPMGVVPLRPDGTPCRHEYEEIGPVDRRRYGDHRYKCKHCDDRYMIDSGD